MNIDPAQQDGRTARSPATADDMLDAVHRHLVQIHAAMAERLSTDREIKTWAQDELMDVIREIGAFRRSRAPQGKGRHQEPA